MKGNYSMARQGDQFQSVKNDKLSFKRITSCRTYKTISINLHKFIFKRERKIEPYCCSVTIYLYKGGFISMLITNLVTSLSLPCCLFLCLTDFFSFEKEPTSTSWYSKKGSFLLFFFYSCSKLKLYVLIICIV